MKGIKVWMAAMAAGMMITGCGQSQIKETAAPSVQETTDVSTDASERETEAAERETETLETEAMEPEENQAAAGETYEDNFAVDSAASAAFAREIKAAVEEKDLEKLADLTAFPVYVGLDGGQSVDSREELIALGADRIFTPELLASVAAADENSLSPSMAGFVLSDGSKANIIFSVREGKLAVSGINE